MSAASSGLIFFRKGSLGVNINHSIWVNPAYGKRSRSYAWGALVAREGAENWILLGHVSKVQDAREEADIQVKLFAAPGVIFEKTYHTTNRTALHLRAEELLGVSNYHPAQNEILWYTVESHCPNITANQIHVAGSGFVGGCHSF